MGSSHSHSGHRKRTREEFLQNGLDHLPPHRVLEILLFYSIPQKDTNELAHQLENRFGSLAGVLDAPYKELLTVNGVGENTAVLLRLISAIARRYYLEKADTAPQDDYMRVVEEKLKAWYVGRTKESLTLVSLDNRLRILHIDEVKTGVADAVQIQYRELAKIALSYNATNVILGHNHPYGTALPSKADQTTTIALINLFREIEIDLLDHLIISGNECVSMRTCGYLIGAI